MKIESINSKSESDGTPIDRVTNPRRHASLMGVSMMVMGNHVQRIHEESCRPYFEAIDREERRKKVLESSERWTEIWSLIFVTFVFTVLPFFSRAKSGILGLRGRDFQRNGGLDVFRRTIFLYDLFPYHRIRK